MYDLQRIKNFRILTSVVPMTMVHHMNTDTTASYYSLPSPHRNARLSNHRRCMHLSSWRQHDMCACQRHSTPGDRPHGIEVPNVQGVSLGNTNDERRADGGRRHSAEEAHPQPTDPETGSISVEDP